MAPLAQRSAQTGAARGSSQLSRNRSLDQTWCQSKFYHPPPPFLPPRLTLHPLSSCPRMSPLPTFSLPSPRQHNSSSFPRKARTTYPLLLVLRWCGPTQGGQRTDTGLSSFIVVQTGTVDCVLQYYSHFEVPSSNFLTNFTIQYFLFRFL